MNPRQPLWYSLLAILATAVVLASVGFWYTNHVQRQSQARYEQLVRDSERKWCVILQILTDGPAPTTERGRVTLEAMKSLRADFGC